MQTHIRTVMGRYKGRVKGWDVVNEAIAEDGSLRQSPWMNRIGEEYLVTAYRLAQDADPAAELYYNDYGLENPAKRKGAIELVRKLKQAGIRLAGIGLQGHYSLDRPSIEQVEATISDFAALGLKVHITELDVDVLPRAVRQPGADVALRAEADPKLNPYTTGLPDDVQKALAERYAALFRVFLKHKDVIERVTFWGVTDRDSWLNNWPVRGRTNYPLLFEREGRPKPAFDAVVKLTR
jgi:endo-1,4-beta-xylanase